MKKFIYLSAIVLFCIGFSGCEKEETKEFIDFEKRQKSSETFFRSSKTKSTDDFTAQIINFLKYIDDRTHFTEEFLETYGRPWWDICKTTYAGNTALRIVPIIDTDEIHLSGLQFFGYRNNKFVSFFILNDECAIKTLKNDQMRTLYSNLILNYERVLSKQRLKEVRVVGNGNCYSTFVDALWIKTECRLTVADWEPNGPSGPNNPQGPGEPSNPNGSGGYGGSEPIGGGTSGNGGPGSGGSIPECKYIDGECHIIGWLKPIEVPKEIVPKLLPEVKNLTQAEIKDKLCHMYSGIIDTQNLNSNLDKLTIDQEQYIIGLANIAALSQLGLSLESLKTDLGIYSKTNGLYSKFNQLDNHERYTQDWTETYNSSANSNYALISEEINDLGFALKFYPEKNGYYNALGLVKDGLIDHTLEGALEFIEGWLRDNKGYNDDFLYDMHLYNSLNLMEGYCNE